MSAAEKFHLSPNGNLAVEICHFMPRVRRWIREIDGGWIAELVVPPTIDASGAVVVSLSRAEQNPLHYLARLGISDMAYFLRWLNDELPKEPQPSRSIPSDAELGNILAGIHFE